MKQFFFLFSAVFISLFYVLSTKAEAHLGSGPPFLKINGKYAQNNPYFQGLASTDKISIAQDNAPENYLVNVPLSFDVDITQLLFPPDIANTIQFRWYFSDQNKEYKDGRQIEYTYKKPGSYLLSLVAKLPDQPDYILIDTLRLHMLPFKGYKLPETTIIIETDNAKADEPVILKSQTTFDFLAKPTKYTWVVESEKVFQGQEICYTFQNPNLFTEIDHRVQDSNGFINDVSFTVNATDNNLKFLPAISPNAFPVKVIPLSKNKSFFDISCVSRQAIASRILTIVVPLTIIVLVATFLLFKPKKG